MRKSDTWKVALLACLFGGAVVLSGCGDDDSGTPSADASTDGQVGDGGTPDDAGADADVSADAGSDAAVVMPAPVRFFFVPIVHTDQNAAAYRTQEQLQAFFNSAKLKQFFADNSYGQALYEATVVAPFTHPATSTAVLENFTLKDAVFYDNLDFTIPGYDGVKDHLVLFHAIDASKHGYITGSITNDISGPAGRDVKVNGEVVYAHIYLTVDLSQQDSPRNYAINWYDYDAGMPKSEEGEISGEPLPLNTLEQTFLHEAGHKLGVASHSFAWTNGERHHFEDSGGEKVNYGDNMSTMGTQSSVCPNFSGAYRLAIGWGAHQTQFVEPDSDQVVTIYPINTRDKTTIAAYRTSAFSGAGLYLDVRAGDDWHHFMANHPRLRVNTEGIMLHRRDDVGVFGTSHLLDATPTLDGQYGKSLDDVTLRPGMEVHFPDASLTDVTANADGSYSVRFRTFGTDRDILGTPTGVSSQYASSTLTMSWDVDNRHSDTESWVVVTTTPDGVKAEHEQANPATGSLTIDNGGGALPSGTRAYVIAKGKGLAANRSREVVAIP